jgi:hypothetical protein
MTKPGFEQQCASKVDAWNYLFTLGLFQGIQETMLIDNPKATAD